MKAEQLEKEMKAAFGDAIIASRVQERKVGKHSHSSLWLRVKRETLRPSVELLIQKRAQLSVISGTDNGDNVELLYHFAVGGPVEEIMCNICVSLPKTDLTVPTITDLVPGAVLTEREKQEFFGIDVIGLKDKRRAFLADDLKKAHPWIKDDKETCKFARNVHEEARK